MVRVWPRLHDGALRRFVQRQPPGTCGNDREVSARLARGKVFCIGANKTGTTSMEALLKRLGFAVAPQEPAELLLEDWGRRDFGRLLAFCENYEAFQDIPFSLPFTYQVLDEHFPNAKFILTVRDSAEDWYSSLVRFETQFFELGRRPTAADMKAHGYMYEGWFWRSHQLIWGVNEQTLYEPQRYMAQYRRHNDDVVTYFEDRTDDLLVLNVATKDAAKRICRFLSVNAPDHLEMPHLNRSQ